jgi:hypothetical protein
MIAFRLDRHLLLTVPLEASMFLIALRFDRHWLLAVPSVLLLLLFCLVIVPVLFFLASSFC